MNEESFELKYDMCDRQVCFNKATKKPVVQLRSSPMMTPEDVCIGVKVCDEHATQKDADDLIEGAKIKGMLQDILKAKSGKAVEWSCSGVVWIKIT